METNCPSRLQRRQVGGHHVATWHVFLPAAGNRNGTSVNNAGSNGNYWSSSYNNSNNARYVNFNSGNLTSQLFSNVYLNVLDQYMKRELKCKHYGRYVDDFYVVSADKVWLLSIVPKVRSFLSERLGLDFHDGKLQLTSVWHGVEFLGAWLKPHRIYVSRNSVGRIKRKLELLALESTGKWFAPLNSYCGLLSHWNSFNVRQTMLTKRHQFTRFGMFDHDVRHFYD